MTCVFAQEHFDALDAGESVRIVAARANACHVTLFNHWKRRGGQSRSPGRRPLSDATKASIVAAIKSGTLTKVAAIDHKVSRMTVYRTLRECV